jgi:hypothetical protein
MKKFEFNYAQQQWDRYSEFHTNGGWRSPFTEFANGQLIITNTPDLDVRRMYEKYGIQLVSTTDGDLPPLYLSKEDEKPIPKAWVQQGGQQHLAVDHERGVAVAIGRNHYYGRGGRKDVWSTTVPDNLRSPALVYWAGDKRLPIASMDISVSRPDPATMKAMLPKLDEVRPALHAIDRMKNPPIPNYYQTGKVDVRLEWLDMTTEELVVHLSKDDSTLKSAVVCGFASKRIITEVPYLYVKGE